MCRVEVALYQCSTRFTIDCQIRALLCIFPSVCGSLVIVFVSEEDFKRSLERGHSWQLPPLQLQCVMCVILIGAPLYMCNSYSCCLPYVVECFVFRYSSLSLCVLYVTFLFIISGVLNFSHSLEENEIKPSGATALADALITNWSLKTLK